MNKYILALVSIVLTGCTTQRIEPSPEDVDYLRDLFHKASIEQQNCWKSIPLTHRKETMEARAVCEAFWNPRQLNRYGEVGWGYDLYSKAQYLIIQTEVDIATKNDNLFPDDLMYAVIEFNHIHSLHRLDENKWSLFECTNFYPHVKIAGSTILRLTPKLKHDLEAFLGSDFTEFGTPNIMSTSQAIDQSAERMVAAERFITIFPDHWGNGWHLVSHPKIQLILFDHDYTKALVAFRIGYEGGFAYLKKGMYDWEFVESRMSWVE